MKAIAAGAFHNVVLAGHTVRTWGLNHVGQLGDGSTQYTRRPIGADMVGGIVGVAAGWYHSFAVQNEGTTWAWGWNYFGQLGTGGTADALKPVAVLGVEPATMAAGPTHTLAVTARGQ